MSLYEDTYAYSSPSILSSWDNPETLAHRNGAVNGPQSLDDYAFLDQFDEIDLAYENLAKNARPYGPSPRREYSASLASNYGKHARMGAHGSPGPRPHSIHSLDDARHHHNSLQVFYAHNRHAPSRGPHDYEHAMQAKRRMAAQRERELRNLHTEQQYQRIIPDVGYPSHRSMSEEETRQLIARQRSALYGEGPFADKAASYVDETGTIRSGMPGAAAPLTMGGPSPMTFDLSGRANPARSDAPTPTASASASASQQVSPVGAVGENGARAAAATPPPNATVAAGPGGIKSALEGTATGATAHASRPGSTHTPADSSAKAADLAPGAGKPGQNPPVAPIGTRPSGTSIGSGAASASSSSKRSTTPLTSPAGWGRTSQAWGQPPTMGAQVWG